MRPFERVVTALEARGLVVHSSGRDQYRCPFPSHGRGRGDENPSLSITEAPDGKVLVKCQTGCETKDVVQSLGLEMRDLFPADARPGRGRDTMWTTDELRAKCTPPYPAVYVDDSGSPIFLVARFDTPGRGKSFVTFRPSGSTWTKGLGDEIRRPLFRLPAVLRAINAGEVVHVTEGEKCVAALEALRITATTNPFGAKSKWTGEHSRTLSPAARIVVWADTDAPGRKHAYAIADSLVHAGAKDVRLVELEGPAKYDVADWVGEQSEPEVARAALLAMVDAVQPYVPAAHSAGAADGDVRPTITLGPEIHEIGDEAVAALAARPDVGLFVRGRELVRVVRDSASRVEGLTRTTDAPTIRRAEPETLREILSRVARFRVWSGGEDGCWIYKPPPLDLAKAILARGEWLGLPILDSVIESPVLLADGRVLNTPGYDATTGLFYEPRGGPVTLADVAGDPRGAAARAAAALLAPFDGYKFADPKVSSAALLAAILTPTARHLIDGPVPMFGVSAPKARSGKGKLCTAVGIIATGRAPAAFAGVKAREEWDKLLAAIAQEGDRVLVLDNIVWTLRSPELAYAITAGTYRAREFGQNKKTIRAPWNATVLLNGNGLRLASDLSFRTIPIEIDFQVERPDLLKFDFDVVERVQENRPALYGAALTILRAHLVAGRPTPLDRWSDFRSWDIVVRQCVAWVGLGDCRAGRERLIEEADDDLQLVRIVFDAWRSAFGDEAETVPEAVRRALGSEAGGSDKLLRDALEAIDPKLDARKIGAFLSTHKNDIVGGLKLTADAKKRHQYTAWRVIELAKREEGGAS